jgi:hypothetical protein
MRVKTSIRTEGEKLRAETSRLNDARVRLAGVQEKRQSLSERQAELRRCAKPHPRFQRASPTSAS